MHAAVKRKATAAGKAGAASPFEGLPVSTPRSPNAASAPPAAGTALVKALEQELEQTRAWMADWIGEQRHLYDEHVRKQERLLRGLTESQGRALEDLRLELGLSPQRGWKEAPFRAAPPLAKCPSVTTLGREQRSHEHSYESTCMPMQTYQWTSNFKDAKRSEEQFVFCPPPVERDDDVASLQTEASNHLDPALSQRARAHHHHDRHHDQRARPHDHRHHDLNGHHEALPEGLPEDCPIDAELRELHKCDHVLNLWRRTSGLQTVMNWVSDYTKHTGGWAALLMIHGIPEVTGRLRNKVENYAIYSALFLSMSITLLADKPEFITTCEEHRDHMYWVCHLQLRVYFYGLLLGISAHMLSILLAMAFLNALNESARDSDVYRMFSRGRGFQATVECQYAFRAGCACDLVSVLTSVTYHIGMEALLVGALLLLLVMAELRRTATRLHRTACIVEYWRGNTPGAPDPDDPYDLEVPVGIFQECAAANTRFFLNSDPKSPTRGAGAGPEGALWTRLKRDLRTSAGISSPASTPQDGSMPLAGRLSGVSQMAHTVKAAVTALI